VDYFPAGIEKKWGQDRIKGDQRIVHCFHVAPDDFFVMFNIANKRCAFSLNVYNCGHGFDE